VATNPTSDIWPVANTWVRRPGGRRIGRVAECREQRGTVLIDWGNEEREEVAVEEIESGIQPGFVVQDVPASITRRTLGIGFVRAVRKLAGCDQSLVQLQHDGRSLWLPSFNLVRIMGADLAFARAEPRSRDRSGERWALCMIAHALRSWNEATGALDRLDVDPLPHQIQLVHKIINSGQTNWVIADDVGLGKTIEVGLLLAALERRQRLSKVLVVCPPGLTVQWQQEMRFKFDRTFEIYDKDFSVNEPWKWKLHDHVIASLDLVKPRQRDDDGAEFTSHFGRILGAGNWDLVVFDEAHRLSRTDQGDQTLRFLLGRALRQRTNALLLLTGTPHQGDTGKFRSLLQLVRPDLKDELDELEVHPEIVAEVVLRNRKIDVTDADGKFIFQGHTVRRLPIEPTAEMRELNQRLRIYLAQGYGAGAQIGGFAGRAIGFVMTTYRKLASSSVAALQRALERRRERILAGETAAAVRFDLDAFGDDYTPDDIAELDLGEPRDEFFASESETLTDLINLCERAAAFDSKIETFRRVYQELVVEQKKKILVFTEYRATQERIAEEILLLSGRYPALIHGGQKLEEKIAAMLAFDGDTDVLVSTEAGGEGLNLHRRCHIVVNFDLPWNPARIVQRIGRVYRYGQQEHVAVVNFHSTDTIDSEIVSTAVSKVSELSRQMATVSAEFDERYATEILGELLDQLDLSEALNEALSGSVERTESRIREAIERARRARELQSEVLSAASGFDPEALIRLGRFRTRDVLTFILRIAPFMGFEAALRNEAQERLELRLPENWRGRFPEFGGRTVIDATTSRGTAAASPAAQLIDFGSSFLRELVAFAISPEFGGGYGCVEIERIPEGHSGGFLIRWQSDQGDPVGEELTIAHRSFDGQITFDNSIVSALLAEVVGSRDPELDDPVERADILESIIDRIEVDAAARISRFKQLNDIVLVAAADVLNPVPSGIVDEVSRTHDDVQISPSIQ
jgi:superfamily II DNA or RNA helicase